MEIFAPLDEGYTIYSKIGCINCTKIKQFLKQKKIFFLEVQCDEFLLEDKEQFLLIINEIDSEIDWKKYEILLEKSISKYNNHCFVDNMYKTEDYCLL